MTPALKAISEVMLEILITRHWHLLFIQTSWKACMHLTFIVGEFGQFYDSWFAANDFCVCACEFSAYIFTIRTSLEKVLLKQYLLAWACLTETPSWSHGSVIAKFNLLATWIVLYITLTNGLYSLNSWWSSFWHVPIPADLCLYIQASCISVLVLSSWFHCPWKRSTCYSSGILASKLHKFRSKYQQIKKTIRT